MDIVFFIIPLPEPKSKDIFESLIDIVVIIDVVLGTLRLMIRLITS